MSRRTRLTLTTISLSRHSCAVTRLHAQDALGNSGAAVAFLTSDLDPVLAGQSEGLTIEDPISMAL